MLRPVSIMYGCDPELFAQQDGQVIGSEKVIPEEGLKTSPYARSCIVRDGVQIELQPIASYTVGLLGIHLTAACNLLRKHLVDKPGVSPCFTGVVEVTREELDSLSEKSRILGCQPSQNIYGTKPIMVDPIAYRKRSAGGHLHLGLNPNNDSKNLFEERANLVPLLDIFVGNTCVMLDRDPQAAERRETYGRAGEYRTPLHGLEYRTLSNFWLRNFTLLNFVLGMSNVAIATLSHKFGGNEDIEQQLVDTVDIDNVIQAINTNDFDLARRNFETVRPFLARHLPEQGFPLAPSNIDRFVTFAEGVNNKGLEAFFPEEPVTAWTSGKQVDFSKFLQTIY